MRKNISIELREMTWEQIDQNLLRSRVEFNKELDVERALEGIEQINSKLNRLVEYEKRNTANTGIIAKHLGLIACGIGVYVADSGDDLSIEESNGRGLQPVANQFSPLRDHACSMVTDSNLTRLQPFSKVAYGAPAKVQRSQA